MVLSGERQRESRSVWPVFRLWRVALLWFFALIFPATAAWSEVAVPPLKTRVTDLTNTLSATQTTQLESDLTALEQRSGAQLAVLLLPSTAPESIEQFSMRVVETWKLGHKGRDDGVLLLVAKNDRRLRIEVGYGLEGKIPDAIARRVIDEAITPLFKQGDFAGGIAEGVTQLAALIEGQSSPFQSAPTEPPAPPREDTVIEPRMLDLVRDLTGTVDEDLTWRLSRRLHDFYNTGRTKPVYVLLVPSTGNEALSQYAERVLRLWGDTEQLDIDRSLLLVIAADIRQAAIAAGDGLRTKIPPGASEALTGQTLAARLQANDLSGALDAAIPGIEHLIDLAIANKSLEDRLAEHAESLMGVMLVGLVFLGTLLRWMLGPFFGGISMGSVVGTGVWFLSGEIQVALIAGGIAFIFVLVGVANWVSMASSGSGRGGGSSSGSFSGGGGSFGGGGSSGSW